MKSTLQNTIISFLLLISIQLNAQNQNLTGTLILNNNDTLRGLVNLMLETNSFNVEYINSKSENTIYKPEEVKSLSLQNGSTYETHAITNAEGKEVKVFLEYFIGGSIGFYSYLSSDLKERFFIRNEMGNLRELKYTEEVKFDSEGKDHLVKKKLYIGELNYAMSKCTDKNFKQDISKTNLKKEEILKLIKQYYSCTNEEFQVFYNTKREKISFEIEVLGGLNSLKINDSDNIIGSNIGVMVNIFIPRTQGRYSINIGYIQSFYGPNKSSEKVSFGNTPFILNRYFPVSNNYKMYIRAGIDRISIVNYRSTGLLTGVGHEFSLLDNKLKIFNTLDYRFSVFNRFSLNLGVKYSVQR